MPGPLSRLPSAFEVYSDRAFRALTIVVAWLVIVLIVVIVARIGTTAGPAVRKYGLGFVARIVNLIAALSDVGFSGGNRSPFQHFFQTGNSRVGGIDLRHARDCFQQQRAALFQGDSSTFKGNDGLGMVHHRLQHAIQV